MEIVKMLSRIPLIGFIAVILFSLTSCKMIDVTYYKHDQSREFEEYFKLKDIDTVDQSIVFTVEFRSSGSEIHRVWLSLYSESSDRLVYVTSASFKVAGQDVSLELNENFEVSEKKPGAKYFHRHILLGTLDNEYLERSALDGGEIDMTLFYKIEGQSQIMAFPIRRITTKTPLFPT